MISALGIILDLASYMMLPFFLIYLSCASRPSQIPKIKSLNRYTLTEMRELKWRVKMVAELIQENMLSQLIFTIEVKQGFFIFSRWEPIYVCSADSHDDACLALKNQHHLTLASDKRSENVVVCEGERSARIAGSIIISVVMLVLVLSRQMAFQI